MKYEYYDMKLEYKEKLTNKNRNITTKKTEYKYITEPGKTTGKDDLNSDEEGFVKLLKKYKGAEKSLKELILWFFDSVEAQESICDMEDLLKYLLQKEMNIDLGVEEFDFDEYGNDKMNIAYSGGISIEGNSFEEKVWNAFRTAGYSEYATAGAMSNFSHESGFISNNLENSFESIIGMNDEQYTQAVNNGSYTRDKFISDHTMANAGAGYGLAQWTWYTRKAALYDYAKSKGVGIDNEEMQIMFILGEVNPNGGADGYASFQALETRGYTYSQWTEATNPEDAALAFCALFEGPESDYNLRRAQARTYYEQYKGKMPTVWKNNSEVQNNNSENYTGNTTSSTNGRYTTVNFGGRTYNIYDQTDPTGEFGLSNPSGACSITSEAIVLSGYINCTPSDTQSHYPKSDFFYKSSSRMKAVS